MDVSQKAVTKQLDESMIEVLVSGYIHDTMKCIDKNLPVELIEIVYNYFNFLFDYILLQPIEEINEWLQELNETQKTNIIQSFTNGTTDDLDIEIPIHLNEQPVLLLMLKKLDSWKNDIQSVVNRDKSFCGEPNTIQKQIEFWKSKMNAIEHIELQLQTAEFCASMIVLMKNNYIKKRKENQIQIQESKKDAASTYGILATFPIKTLIESTSICEIIKAINEIFHHLDASRFGSGGHLSRERAAYFADMVGSDVANKVKDVLCGIPPNIMSIEYSLFVDKTLSTERLFHNFRNKYTKLRCDLRQRELLECGQKSIFRPWYREESCDLDLLQKRIESIKKIRKEHNAWQQIIPSVFEWDTENLCSPYNIFTKLHVFSVPIDEWERCVKEYETKMVNNMKKIVQNALQNAQGDKREIFRVCDGFSKLFIHYRYKCNGIPYGVLEFKDEIIKYSKEDIKWLQSRYNKGYQRNICNIPNVSGEIMWIRQMKNELDQIEKRLVSMFGCEHLEMEINSFAKKLDPKIILKQWEMHAKSIPNFDDLLPIFRIDHHENGCLALNVEFDEKYVELINEVDFLLSLGIRIDICLRLKCIDAKMKYPVAVKLKEALSIFTKVCVGIDQHNDDTDNTEEEMKDNEPLIKEIKSFLPILIDEYRYQCQQQILNGTKYRWMDDDKELNNYADQLIHSIMLLKHKTKEAYDLSLESDQIITELAICSLFKENITEKLQRLQKIVNKLHDGGFYGVSFWCDMLNNKLEIICSKRIDEILDKWIKTVDKYWNIMKAKLVEKRMNDSIFLTTETIQNATKMQVSIVDAKMLLLQDLQYSVSTIIDGVRIKSNRLREDDENCSNNRFELMLNQITVGKITDCYRKIEDIIVEASKLLNNSLSG